MVSSGTDLEMLVRLARPRYLSRVVAGEGIHLSEADEEGFTVFLRELTSLTFERIGGDQQMVLEHAEFVQEGRCGSPKLMQQRGPDRMGME